jgi:hypothetical protein
MLDLEALLQAIKRRHNPLVFDILLALIIFVLLFVELGQFGDQLIFGIWIRVVLEHGQELA